MLSVSNYNLPLFSCLRTNLLSNFLNFIVEGFLLIKVSNFVSVGLILEIPTLIRSEGLPLFAYFLHHLKGAHLWVSVHYQGSCLSEIINSLYYLFHKDHVSW